MFALYGCVVFYYVCNEVKMSFLEFDGLAKFFEAEAFQCYLIELGWSDYWDDSCYSIIDKNCFDSKFNLLGVYEEKAV